MSSALLSLEGKAAIVTGSSRGIGAGIAKRLAKLGANVVVNYLTNESAANSVVAEINTDRDAAVVNGNSSTKTAGQVAAIAVQADAGTIAGGQQLLTECLKAFGRIDILILNAGRTFDGAMAETDESEFDRAFDLHVKGPLFLSKAAAEHMKEGGRILFTSGLVTKKSTILPTYVLQASTKGAIEQISRVLAKDLTTRGITVNTISPGPIDTEGLRSTYSEHKLNFIASIHPMKRIGQISDITNLVAFLMSPEAEWISGQNIGINGALVV